MRQIMLSFTRVNFPCSSRSMTSSSRTARQMMLQFSSVSKSMVYSSMADAQGICSFELELNKKVRFRRQARWESAGTVAATNSNLDVPNEINQEGKRAWEEQEGREG
mmetsp:Transcript_236/g.535  ORF Transcript_236/g.535 Transcript_236/m.535 type:complete len:107 (+) Transcript_236:294-614(+)